MTSAVHVSNIEE